MRKFFIAFIAVCLCLFASLPVFADEGEAGKDLMGFFDWLDQDEVDLYGSIEAEFVSEESFDPDEDTGTESTVSYELGLSIEPNPWLGGMFEVSTEYEKPVTVDEAWVTVGNPERFPLYLTVGKMTLPFGLYESAMLSDSLTLELGETTSTAAQLGLEWEALYLKAFGYEAESRQQDEEDELRSFGADAGFLLDEDDFGIQLGASWISDFEDSDRLTEYLNDEEFTLLNRVPGVAAYASVTLGVLTLAVEHVESIKRPRLSGEDGIEERPRQKAWTTELMLDVELEGIVLEVGLMYSESDDALDILPRQRMGGALTVYPFEHLRISVEYLQEKDYQVNHGGTDSNADIVTFQLAMEL